MSDDEPYRHYLIHGRVQGVGYRHFVWRKALELGIRGWVRNLEDGSVEVVAWGPEIHLEALSAHLTLGPRSSQVDSVSSDRLLEPEAPTGQFFIRS